MNRVRPVCQKTVFIDGVVNTAMVAGQRAVAKRRRAEGVMKTLFRDVVDSDDVIAKETKFGRKRRFAESRKSGAKHALGRSGKYRSIWVEPQRKVDVCKNKKSVPVNNIRVRGFNLVIAPNAIEVPAMYPIRGPLGHALADAANSLDARILEPFGAGDGLFQAIAEKTGSGLKRCFKLGHDNRSFLIVWDAESGILMQGIGYP